MRQDMFCIYPIHVDSTLSIAKGRKYPAAMCIPRPSFAELCSALTQLDIEHEKSPSKRHPRDPFVFGRVHVSKKYGKAYVVQGILKAIAEARSKLTTQEKAAEKAVMQKDAKNAPANPLNLVAKKKKGSKGK